MAKIVINVSPFGKLNVEASGFTGTSCKAATDYLQKLGVVTETEYKPEYYEEPETEKIRE